MRFEHALKSAADLGAGTANAHLGELSRRDIERAKWRLWHGRWKGCLVKLAGVCGWTETRTVRDAVGAEALRHHLKDLIVYLESNQAALVNYGARRRRGEPVSTAFVESAINEIVSRRMIKKPQMRWNRWTVQAFLDVRAAVLNGTLEGQFCGDIPTSVPRRPTIRPREAHEFPRLCMLSSAGRA